MNVNKTTFLLFGIFAWALKRTRCLETLFPRGENGVFLFAGRAPFVCFLGVCVSKREQQEEAAQATEEDEEEAEEQTEEQKNKKKNHQNQKNNQKQRKQESQEETQS